MTFRLGGYGIDYNGDPEAYAQAQVNDMWRTLPKRAGKDATVVAWSRTVLHALEAAELAAAEGIETAVADAGEKLAQAFLDLECLLVEVNPLFVQSGGRWVAGDAKVITDDNALPRQRTLEALVQSRAAAYPEIALKHEHGFDYVVVDPGGEIGLLTTGAGLSMMLIDEMRETGLKLWVIDGDEEARRRHRHDRGARLPEAEDGTGRENSFCGFDETGGLR